MSSSTAPRSSNLPMDSVDGRAVGGDATDGADCQAMELALEQARLAADLGEVPVGAVLLRDGRVIARAHNRRETDQDPTAHAEMIVLRQAASLLKTWRLDGCVLYVTLEPCAMCAGAIVNARVSRLVYGAVDPKGGAVESLFTVPSDARLNHNPTLRGGVLEAQCGRLLSTFFRDRRPGGRLGPRRMGGADFASLEPPS